MNNQEENNTYTCSRCGNIVNIGARCCTKCGNLNPNHPDNKSFAKYMGKESYSTSSGIDPTNQVNRNVINSKTVNLAFGSHMGNYNLCFLLNLAIYLGGMFAIIIYYLTMSKFQVDAFLLTPVYYFIWILSFGILYIYSYELLFMKMNIPWWAALIPIYNIVAFANAVQEKKILNLLLLVPIIGEIYLLYLLYKMGKDFNKPGLLTILLFGIMVPIIAYGSSAFKGICYLSGRDTLEEEFRKKRGLLIFNIIIIVVSAAAFLYNNAENLQQSLQTGSTTYYVKISNLAVEGIKEKIIEGKYNCDYTSDIMYFYYSNIFDEYKDTFSIFKDPIEAYIKVVRTYSETGTPIYSYYITMTDKRFGFKETLIDDLTEDSVINYTEISTEYKNGNSCSTVVEDKKKIKKFQNYSGSKLRTYDII